MRVWSSDGDDQNEHYCVECAVTQTQLFAQNYKLLWPIFMIFV